MLPTDKKRHNVTTTSSAENMHVEVNMYVTPWSDPLTEVTEQKQLMGGVGVAETETPFHTPKNDTEAVILG